LNFGRPSDAQREVVLFAAFKQLAFTPTQIKALVTATGPLNGRQYGFTYSDLTQRLIPAIVLDAYPAKPIDPARAVEIAREILPTPPFDEKPV
jgi:hypothetical protein